MLTNSVRLLLHPPLTSLPVVLILLLPWHCCITFSIPHLSSSFRVLWFLQRIMGDCIT
jgi:hypothetical protein